MSMFDEVDEPRWDDAVTIHGLYFEVFRAKFQKGPLTHCFIAELRPIDGEEYEGTTHHIVMAPETDGNSAILTGPPSSKLYRDKDSAVAEIEAAFEALKKAKTDS
jgi:hypothetical protein